jgi:hypothetical protein
MVAGMIGVLHSFVLARMQKKLSPDETYLLLTKSADEAGDHGPDPAYGFGIINPIKALESLNA